MLNAQLANAIINNNIHEITALLVTGADINARNSSELTALHIACSKGHLEIAKLLLDKGADIDAYNSSGMTALHTSCINGHTEVVKLLLDNRANIKACNNSRLTALHIACSKGHLEIAKLLLENGADINAGYGHGPTPLHIACVNGHTEVVKLLLVKGADINARNSSGQTPLYTAFSKRYLEIAKLLLENGADVNAGDHFGQTPLRHILSYWNAQKPTEIFPFLLTHDIEINDDDRNLLRIAHDSEMSADERNLLVSKSTPEAAARCDVITASLMVDAGTDKSLSALFSPYMEMRSMIPNRAPAVAQGTLTLPHNATDNSPDTLYTDSVTTADPSFMAVVESDGVRRRTVDKGEEDITTSPTSAEDSYHGTRIKRRRCCDFVRGWFR